MSAPSISIGEAFDDPMLLGQHFAGASWRVWKILLRSAFAEPLDPEEVEIFRALAGGRDPPKERVRELWIVAGRRSGKTSIAAGVACYLSCFVDYAPYLREGERALLPVFSTSRDQSQTAFGYIKAMLGNTKLLRGLVEDDGYETLSLTTSCDLGVMTASFRSSRGRTMAACILEECAFWRAADGSSANPDLEIYRAVKPSLSTIKGSMVIGISSSYRKQGLLWSKYRDNYGKDTPILVIRAETRQLNGLIDQQLIDEELRADPSAASAEWLSTWRDDIASYIDREVVERLVVPGRFELGAQPAVSYMAFADPAGGSGGDSFCLAIGHSDDASKHAVLDVLREWRPRFSPLACVAECAQLLRQYGCNEVSGDNFGGATTADIFASHNITYRVTEPPRASKSDIYAAFIGPLNNGTVELLDNERLVNQLCNLERRVVRGSNRPSIDHSVGAHDDLANAAAGCLIMCGENNILGVWERLGTPDAPPAPREQPMTPEPAILTASNHDGLRLLTIPGEPVVVMRLPERVGMPLNDPSDRIAMLPRDRPLAVPRRLLDADGWLLRDGLRVVRAERVEVRDAAA